MPLTVALTGDVILTAPIRQLALPGLHDVREVLSHADVSIAHFESLIHRPGVADAYAAAEAGWTWLRSPEQVVDEMTWLGVDAVTLASNHALDFSYGGMRATVEAFARRGLATAGTGEDLAAASAPAYLRSGLATVGLVSMSSTYSAWSRAGAARFDAPGRPGLNPLVTSYCGSDSTLAPVLAAARSMGHWVTEVADGEWWTNPAGLHNTVTRFVRSAHDELTTTVDAADRARHLAVIREARTRCDVLVVQCHNHEWEPAGGLAMPPRFMREFARAAVDAGADVVLAEGSHAPLRGIEIHGGGVVFYDPGDLFYMTHAVTTFPQDFYDRHRHGLGDVRTATPREGQRATSSARYRKPLSPLGGYASGPVLGGILPVCCFGEDGRLLEVVLHPFGLTAPGERVGGVPQRLAPAERQRLVEHLATLSEPFGTSLHDDGDTLSVVLPATEGHPRHDAGERGWIT